LQLTSLAYAKGSTTLLSLGYGYSQNSGNDGEITSITDSVDSGRSAAYTYDALGRLATEVTTGSTNYPKWGLQWAYDRYGNRTGQSIASGCVSPMTCPTNSVTIDATTNRLSGTPYTYDANGNMTNDGSNTLTYDAENHLLTSTGSGSGTYTYDGNGVRVKKVSGSTTTVYVFSGSKVIAEYVNGVAVGSPTREYIYSGGQMIAKIEGGVTNYYHSDHLSARVTTDSTGALAGQQGHFPFGESWYSANSTTKFQFTSYERDAESGNDYAMARYNVNRLGRFSSPDPLAGDTTNPQSLNRYAYVQNDPANRMDPTGLDGDCGGALTCVIVPPLDGAGGVGGFGGGAAPTRPMNWAAFLKLNWDDIYGLLTGGSDPGRVAQALRRVEVLGAAPFAVRA
jgi:RHS repeat-associated protein